MSTSPPARPLPVGRRTPTAWIVAMVAAVALFVFALPALSDALPQTRESEAGETLPLTLGQMSAPEGWEIAIAGAATGTPSLARDDVSVTVFSGLWLGDTEDLLERVAQWWVHHEASAEVPPVEEDDPVRAREHYEIEVTGAQADGLVIVVREATTVVVMRVWGQPKDIEAVRADVDQMIDSLDLEVAELPFQEVPS